MNVAVLGCGPAGLLAAYAANELGHTVDLYSKPEPSKFAGAIFFHEEIPGLTAPDEAEQIRFIKIGTREGYAAKVYGSRFAQCSWDSYDEGSRVGWDMRQLYRRLWAEYGEGVLDLVLGGSDIDALVESYDQVISSIPAQVLCRGGCEFGYRNMWIRPQPDARVLQYDDPQLVIYNGLTTEPWHRTSVLFGDGSTEFGHAVSNAAQGVKPTHNNCDCRPDVLRVGRFGRWQPGVLVHHAFERTSRCLELRAGRVG